MPQVQIEVKECPNCGEEKPPDSFYSNASKDDGLSTYCADCSRRRRAKNRKEMAQKEKDRPDTKTCPRCEDEKPASAFYKVDYTGDALYPYCQDCATERKSEHRERLRQDGPEPPEVKECGRCEEVKVASEFYRRRTSPDGLSYYCKPCRKDYSGEHYEENKKRRKRQLRRWREQNIERAREITREWQKENPVKSVASTERYRSRKVDAEGDLTTESIQVVYWLHDHTCLRCGAAEDLTVDHIVPLSKGGSNHLSNLQLLCRPCNAHKGTNTWDYRGARYA